MLKELCEEKNAALEAALVKRKLNAEEWKATLATFKTRRAEIAKLLKENREQIASNNQKLADKISEDRNDMAKREDEMRRQASYNLTYEKKLRERNYLCYHRG